MLQRSSHTITGTIFTSERGLNTSQASLAHVHNTRANMLFVMFVYFSINSIAASRISSAFNSVFFGYISKLVYDIISTVGSFYVRFFPWASPLLTTSPPLPSQQCHYRSPTHVSATLDVSASRALDDHVKPRL
jgi:hypothetical protein